MDDHGVIILTPGPREHQVPCSKCGETITMTDDLYRQMLALKGEPAHATCPQDAAALAAVLREYRVTILVERMTPPATDTPEDELPEEIEPELLSRAGTTTEARSLVDALPALGSALAAQWDKIIESAPLAELDD